MLKRICMNKGCRKQIEDFRTQACRFCNACSRLRARECQKRKNDRRATIREFAKIKLTVGGYLVRNN